MSVDKIDAWRTPTYTHTVIQVGDEEPDDGGAREEDRRDDE